jgi:dimethylhistidine N-methyltransferase
MNQHISVKKNKKKTDSHFAQDTYEGLSSIPKYLKSKYFYDAEGDKLFQKIMQMEEYYLTDCEYEIINNQKNELLSEFSDNNTPFLLTELGAGDGQKTELLLDHFLNRAIPFRYLPIDISANVLNLMKKNLSGKFPDLEVEPYTGDYFQALEDLNMKEDGRKILLFLGSTIGNFKYEAAFDFLRTLNKNMNKNDLLLIGFDLKKDPSVILPAYDDPYGITAEFNLNLLRRINKELGGNFIPEQFYHHPIYDPKTGEARSYLVSRIDHKVTIDKLGATFNFKKEEPIFTEISQKYDEEMINNLADKTGFQIQNNYYDSRKYFVSSLWQKR